MVGAPLARGLGGPVCWQPAGQKQHLWRDSIISAPVAHLARAEAGAETSNVDHHNEKPKLQTCSEASAEQRKLELRVWGSSMLLAASSMLKLDTCLAPAIHSRCPSSGCPELTWVLGLFRRPVDRQTAVRRARTGEHTRGAKRCVTFGSTWRARNLFCNISYIATFPGATARRRLESEINFRLPILLLHGFAPAGSESTFKLAAEPACSTAPATCWSTREQRKQIPQVALCLLS